MDALQEIIERQTVADRNNEFTVKHEAIGKQIPGSCNHLGKIAASQPSSL